VSSATDTARAWLLAGARVAARVPAAVGVALVRVYQLTLSPLFGNQCKYHPSCSQYAVDALRRYGLVKGSVLAAWRLARCNPWSHGGVDYAEDQRLFA
jgi:putative membrane protein insertion efficiency factor